MTPGIETLKGLPKSPIELCHTPLLANTQQGTKDIRQGRHPDVTREWARVTGWFSEYVYSRDNRRRITKAVLEETDCKLSLQLDPWKIGQGEFLPLWGFEGIARRMTEISGQLYEWYPIAGSHLGIIKVIDESVKMDGGSDDDLILDRTVKLWRAFYPDGRIRKTSPSPWPARGPRRRSCWYNARMVRDDGIFPFVHPLTPGPSACSLYHWDTLVNSRRLYETINLAARLGLDTIAHVELHRQRDWGGHYEPIGHEPVRFKELGGIIKRAGVKIVSLDEVPIICNGRVNEPVAANLGSLIAGLAA